MKDDVTKITIMADFGDAYAWDQKGWCMGLGYNFPDRKDVIEIEKELEDWAGWFYGSVENPAFPWDDFHEKGMSLARRLKDAIRDNGIPVYYDPPFEDATRQGSSPQEIK